MASHPPLPRPDALAVRPVGSHAVLPLETVSALFGAPLRGTETVEVVRLGVVVARLPVAAGAEARTVLSASVDIAPDGLRLRGPLASTEAPQVTPVENRLVLPAALARAWGTCDVATVALGAVAVQLPVAAGLDAGVEIDRALWLGAGRPETARWLPQTIWPSASARATEALDDGALVIPRRVVTETDVRQAMLRHRRIRLTPGQIVTPAAQSLAREHGVFEAPR